MNDDVLIKQLVSARSAIDSAGAAVDAALLLLTGEQTEEPDDAQCRHPKKERQKIPVMGKKKPNWFCKICGHIEETI